MGRYVTSIVVVGLLLGVMLEMVPRKASFVELPPLPVLQPNQRLVGAELLFAGDWVGPESFAFDAEDRMYTGLADGRVVRWDGSSPSYELFGRTGEDRPDCGSYEAEPLCGRPLALRFDANGSLLVLDPYRGLLSFPPSGGKPKLLASKLSDGSQAGLLNDMVMLPEAEDTILITETSSTYQRRDIFFEVLEMGANGRLLAYHPSNGTFEPLLSQLHFPNGICLHADGDSVLFNELTLFRVMRYYFRGPKKNHLEVFAENLPGTPDNIRRIPRTNHYLIGVGAKRAQPFSLLNALSTYPRLRDFIIFVLPRQWAAWVSTVLLRVIPQYGMVIELDTNGNLLEGYQDPTGALAWLSEADEWKGHLYIGSFTNPYLVRAKI